MFKNFLRTIGIAYMVAFISMSIGMANAGTWRHVPVLTLTPSEGDRFLVDIDNALGYIVNNNNLTYSAFPLMTGALRTPTPEETWVVKELNIQPNRVIFGDSGEFLRMYRGEGAQRTGFGIHGYKYFQKEIEGGRKFLSLGCILVADNVHDVLEGSWRANGEAMEMKTVKSMGISEMLRYGV